MTFDSLQCIQPIRLRNHVRSVPRPRRTRWFGEALALLVAIVAADNLTGQERNPSFVVASVKALPGGQPPVFVPPSGVPHRFYRPGDILTSLIVSAYGVQGFQIVGAPDWARSTRFEIDARAPEGTPVEQIPLMLRDLLENRFRLVVRREQRDMRFLALVLAQKDGRLGPRLQQCSDPNKPPAPQEVAVPRGGYLLIRSCTTIFEIMTRGTAATGTPVVDRTGLTGLWTYTLEYARPARAETPRTEVPEFSVALQEQLGLKLESRRAPVDVLVIESVQQPTPN